MVLQSLYLRRKVRIILNTNIYCLCILIYSNNSHGGAPVIMLQYPTQFRWLSMISIDRGSSSLPYTESMDFLGDFCKIAVGIHVVNSLTFQACSYT